MTKIAVPSISDIGLESNCVHFGSCEYFTIVDLQDNTIAGIKVICSSSPDGVYNCTVHSTILKSQDVETVLVSGISGRPLMSLAENKIKVFVGVEGKISDAIQDYNNGRLLELSSKGTCNYLSGKTSGR